METDKMIQQKIEASLNSLDGIKRAEASPFFYTKLIGRLGNQPVSIWEKFSALITRPAIAFSCMCLIVLMNLIAVYSNSEASTANGENELTASEEFTQVAPNFYDIENTKP